MQHILGEKINVCTVLVEKLGSKEITCKTWGVIGR